MASCTIINITIIYKITIKGVHDKLWAKTLKNMVLEITIKMFQEVVPMSNLLLLNWHHGFSTFIGCLLLPMHDAIQPWSVEVDSTLSTIFISRMSQDGWVPHYKFIVIIVIISINGTISGLLKCCYISMARVNKPMALRGQISKLMARGDSRGPL